MSVVEVTNHDVFLKTLGFKPIERNFQRLMVLVHPTDSNLTLVAFQHRGRGHDSRLDLFTEITKSSVSHPANAPGDPKNICLGIPDHDPVFIANMVPSVVEHFKALEV